MSLSLRQALLLFCNTVRECTGGEVSLHQETLGSLTVTLYGVVLPDVVECIAKPIFKSVEGCIDCYVTSSRGITTVKFMEDSL